MGNPKLGPKTAPKGYRVQGRGFTHDVRKATSTEKIEVVQIGDITPIVHGFVANRLFRGKNPKQAQVSVETALRNVLAQERERQNAETRRIVADALAKAMESAPSTVVLAAEPKRDPNAHEFLKAWREEPEPSAALIEMVNTRVRI